MTTKPRRGGGANFLCGLEKRPITHRNYDLTPPNILNFGRTMKTNFNLWLILLLVYGAIIDNTCILWQKVTTSFLFLILNFFEFSLELSFYSYSNFWNYGTVDKENFCVDFIHSNLCHLVSRDFLFQGLYFHILYLYLTAFSFAYRSPALTRVPRYSGSFP